MKSNQLFYPVRDKVLFYLPMLLLIGCSTPQHTNVLIFGTNTKFALDLSQDPTGGVGVTLGFKREEAVWMPLLPNQSKSTNNETMVPATCTSNTACPKYLGSDGTNTDTYSVLASFGSKVGSGLDPQANKAEVKAQIAQYFATGLAARELAIRGGAGLVNTNGEAGLSATDKEMLFARRQIREEEFDKLIVLVTDPADKTKINKERLEAAFAKSPGKEIDEDFKTYIKSATTIDELKKNLQRLNHIVISKPMLVTLTSN